MRVEEGSPNTALKGKGKTQPEFSVFVQGGDSSNEVCQAGERCVIQGREYTNHIRITCVPVPGNCGNPSYTWSMVNTPTVTFSPMLEQSDCDSPGEDRRSPEVGEGGRGAVVQTAVGPDRIVVLAPALDGGTGVGQRREPVFVQAFVT
jgi:hypothetical protein